MKKKLISCPYDGKIMEFYSGCYESVYVVLHPFIKTNHLNPESFSPGSYPSKKEIVQDCQPLQWRNILELSNLSNIKEIDIGLKTMIGILRSHLLRKDFANEIELLYEKHPIVIPLYGEIGALLESKLFTILSDLGIHSLDVISEFGDEMSNYSITELFNGELVPPHGHLFSKRHHLLITTHWTSFYSMICSSRNLVEKIVKSSQLEGFYCDNMTEVWWSTQR